MTQVIATWAPTGARLRHPISIYSPSKVFSSRDVEIRVYALTQEWNEFYAIREDVFLRVDQIVAESGTSFAFPSQTLYFGRDDGLDQERSESAEQMVGD
jgi:MscS family membrane protein